MTKAKKIAASIAAGLTLCATAVTAHADKYPNSFYFQLPDHGGHKFSNYITKTNNHEYAQVHTETGHVSETAYAYLTVYKNNNYSSGAVSETKKVVDLNRDFSLDYLNPDQYKSGSSLCLCFSVGYYGAEVNGSWQP